MILKAAKILLFLVLLFPQALPAHPHIFVTYTYTVHSVKEGMSKIDFTWRFDAMFAQMVLEELKLKDITEKDFKTIKEKAFDNLKAYHYYIQMRVNEKEFKVQDVQDFSAKIEGQNIVYRFSVTLPAPTQKLSIALSDDEFYTDLSPPTEQVGNPVGGVLSERDFKAKEFAFVSAADGAKPAKCEQHPLVREHPLWGKITTYAAVCMSD